MVIRSNNHGETTEQSRKKGISSWCRFLGIFVLRVQERVLKMHCTQPRISNWKHGVQVDDPGIEVLYLTGRT